MSVSSDGCDTAKDGQEDGPSLPELLAQAGALGEVLEQQQAAFATFMEAHLATIPGMAVPAAPPVPEGLPDFPKLIKQLQDQLTQAEGSLGAMASSLGITMPKGVGAEGMLAALSSFAEAAVAGQLAAKGLPPLPAPPVVPDKLPDFPELIKQLEGQHAKAQVELDAMFAARGLNAKDIEGEFARLVPPLSPPKIPPPPTGIPGADQLATMQAGALQLGKVVTDLMAKLTPH